jgi:hypothetical protein
MAEKNLFEIDGSVELREIDDKIKTRYSVQKVDPKYNRIVIEHPSGELEEVIEDLERTLGIDSVSYRGEM